jgi:plasminogen activator
MNNKLLLIPISLFTSFYITAKDFPYALEVEISILNGEANELVYNNDGSKLSELIWGLDDVKLIGIGGKYFFSENFKFNANLYLNYQEGTSTIDDYDWFYTGMDWTHWSNSPTKINDVLKYNFNFVFNIMPLKFGNVFLTLGYKEDNYKWDAYGGKYIYSDTDNGGFRDQTGTFPDSLLLSYKQNFKTPYIGIGLSFEEDYFYFDLIFTYSNMVEAMDEDMHHARNLYFEDYFEEGKFIGLKVKGSYSLSSNIDLGAFFEFEKYLLNKGWTRTTDTSTGEVSVSGLGSAGIANESSTIGISINYLY